MMNSPPNAIKTLATDLDGTLIPLDGNQQNREDLTRIKRLTEQCQMQLVFVTGRHLSSVKDAIETYDLPVPDWIICDVGTTILQRTNDGLDFQLLDAYQRRLAELISNHSLAKIDRALWEISEIRKQEAEKQGLFKLSFYAGQSDVQAAVEKIQNVLTKLEAPYSIIASIDPFNGDGLIDLLPQGVSKAYALHWWAGFLEMPLDSIVFAGDSGNDLAALVSGCPAILVGNANQELVLQVQRAHQEQEWSNRLFVAAEQATSGVLTGLRHFLRTA